MKVNTVDVDKDRKKDKLRETRKANLIQFISILSGYILMIDVGAHVTWTSPSLPYLTSNKSEIPITDTEGSWLVSIDSLSGIIGQLLYPMIMNRIGRKYTILIFGLMQVSSWILINFAYNYTFLCIARITAGAGIGGTYTFLPLYIGEVSEKSFRGKLIALTKISAHFGGFLMNSAGTFLPYYTRNLVMMSVPIIAICAFPLISETPYFHLLKNREEEAITTLMKLSAEEKREMVMEDIERMKEAIIEGRKTKGHSLQELFVDRNNWKALIIQNITAITYSFSGYLAIKAYAQGILSNTGSSLAPEYAAMILSGVQIFAALPSSQLIDRWGRRPVYLLSGIFSSISLGTVGLFFFLKYREADVSTYTWLPLVALILYISTCTMGIVPIPYVFAGELFSIKIKGVATMCSWCVLSLTGFAGKMMLQFLSSVAGVYAAFWFFTIFCISGPVIVWFIVPETKGKNLEEILVLIRIKKYKECVN